MSSRRRGGPNGDHSLRGSDAADSIRAFYRAIVEGSPLPKFSWKTEKDGSITVRTQTKPRAVNLWQATNRRARQRETVSWLIPHQYWTAAALSWRIARASSPQTSRLHW